MRHTSKLKNIVWYSLVSLLVTVAVLVSVVRLTIGSVSEYRQHLEDMAGRYLGKPVAITEMDARLVGINPTVVLDDISLLDEQNREPLAHFSSIRIALNPISSLRELRPVIDLSIYGAHIVVGLRDDGTLQIQGVTLSQEERTSSNSGALGAWLLGQSRLALKESTLVWRNWATGEEAVFAGGNLELQNLQNRHRLSGFVQLPAELGKELRVAVDINGDLLTQKDWQGQLYVKAVEVRPASWLQQFDYKGLQMTQGSVDLEIWSRWQGGLLEGLEGEFSLADVKFSGAVDPLQLERLAGKVHYENNDDGWLLQLQQLQLEHKDLPDELLALQLEKSTRGTVFQANSLPLTLLHRYTPLLPSLHIKQQDLITQTAPAGRLNAVHVEIGDEGKIRATAGIEEAQFLPWKRYPGISGLNGRFVMNGNAAELVVDSKDLVMTWPHVFRQPLAMEKVSGSVLMNKLHEQWRITLNPLAIANKDIQATLSFDSWIASGESPLLSLQAQFKNIQAASVAAYLPANVMKQTAVRWLDNAFSDGRIVTGRALLHGRLAEFPFRQRHGHFEVEFDSEDVTLNYKDKWPALKHINGKVRFNGPAMTVKAPQARVYSSRLSKVRVGIDDFRKPVLQVEGEVDAGLGDALRFIEESPLAPDASRTLKQMEALGDTDISLALAIPLSVAVAEHHPLTVIGQVTFLGDELRVIEGVVLKDLKGDLLFTEKSFEASAIKGSLYGAPVKLQVFTEQTNGDRQVVVAAQGRATAQALQHEWESPFLEKLKGESDWQSRLTIPYGDADSSRLDVHSTLKGMAVDLPQPATKSRAEARPLALTWQLGQNNKRPNRLAYGELMSAVWHHQLKPFQLLGAAVGFGGKSEPPLPKRGLLQVSGTLENVEFKEWLQLREQLTTEGQDAPRLPIEVKMQRLHLMSSSGEVNGKPLRVKDTTPLSFHVDSFAYGDVPLGRVEFTLQPENTKLLLNDLNIKAPSFTAAGHGQWVEGKNTSIGLTLSSNDFGRMMRELGFASVVTGGEASANGELFWPGSPASFSLSQLEGVVHVKIDDGRIEDVKPGAGKLLGLLSLQALPRRLFLDFSDLSEKGLQFTTIEGDIRLAGGDAFTQNLHIESLPANMLITGRTGLVQRDFDQMIAVIPNVSDTVSVAGGLAWGPQAAAILLVLQKLFQSNIDAAAMTRYHLSGSWSDPKLTKLNDKASSDVGEGL